MMTEQGLIRAGWFWWNLSPEGIGGPWASWGGMPLEIGISMGFLADKYVSSFTTGVFKSDGRGYIQ
jgi:hypothetical protein